MTLEAAKTFYGKVADMLVTDPVTGEPCYEYTAENKPVITGLLQYYIYDINFTKIQPPRWASPYSFKKGNMLVGNCGSGKSKMMAILRACEFEKFGTVNTIDLTSAFASGGYKDIARWGKGACTFNHGGGYSVHHCMFDDLGGEGDSKHYGHACNVMEVTLLHRYELMIKHGLKTHITTNLTMTEIKARYGTRVQSRLLEMCNVFVLGGTADSMDFRTKR